MPDDQPGQDASIRLAPVLSRDEAPITTEAVGDDLGHETEAAAPTGWRLLALGQIDRARAAAAASPDPQLATLIEAIDDGEAMLQELALLQADGAEGPVAAGEGTRLSGVMLAPNPAARHLLVVFGADDGSFAIPASLAGSKRPHLLFIRDRTHTLALLGLDRLGGTYDSCLANILRIQKRLAVARLICLGAGGGMYSALRYGLDLGADGVAVLGTLTRLDSASPPPGKRSARRTALLLEAADRLGNDLQNAYAAAPARPRLAVCRAADDPSSPDPFAGLPGVMVMDAPSRAARRLFAWAEASGRLRLLVAQAMGRPVGRRATAPVQG